MAAYILGLHQLLAAEWVIQPGGMYAPALVIQAGVGIEMLHHRADLLRLKVQLAGEWLALPCEIVEGDAAAAAAGEDALLAPRRYGATQPHINTAHCLLACAL